MVTTDMSCSLVSVLLNLMVLNALRDRRLVKINVAAELYIYIKNDSFLF